MPQIRGTTSTYVAGAIIITTQTSIRFWGTHRLLVHLAHTRLPQVQLMSSRWSVPQKKSSSLSTAFRISATAATTIKITGMIGMEYFAMPIARLTHDGKTSASSHCMNQMRYFVIASMPQTALYYPHTHQIMTRLAMVGKMRPIPA